MATAQDFSSPSPDPLELLDSEIRTLQLQIRAAASRRGALTSSLLSSSKLPTAPGGPLPEPLLKTLNSRISKTKNDNLTSAHRLSLGVTRFTTKDPDPNAVDNREVTGIRIETYNPATRRFDTPAYLFLNRPWVNTRISGGDSAQDEERSRFRVHRHTFPPCVKVDALAAKYLPGPAPLESGKKGRKQDLDGLVRALRRELIGLRRRQDAIALANKRPDEKDRRPKIQTVNAEATDLRILWSDGGIGRVRIDKEGAIGVGFVNGGNGKRLRNLERRIQRSGTILELRAALVEENS